MWKMLDNHCFNFFLNRLTTKLPVKNKVKKIHVGNSGISSLVEIDRDYFRR